MSDNINSNDKLKVISPNKVGVKNDDFRRQAYIGVKKNSTGRKKIKKKNNLKKTFVEGAIFALAATAIVEAGIHCKNLHVGKSNIVSNARDTGAFDRLHVYDDGIRVSNERISSEGDIFPMQDEISSEDAMEMISINLDSSNLSTVEKYISVEDIFGSDMAKKMYGDVTLSQKIAAEEIAYYQSKLENSKGRGAR